MLHVQKQNIRILRFNILQRLVWVKAFTTADVLNICISTYGHYFYIIYVTLFLKNIHTVHIYTKVCYEYKYIDWTEDYYYISVRNKKDLYKNLSIK